MAAWLRRWWNGVRYGSPDGPRIVIDWGAQSVRLENMGQRQAVRVIGWIEYRDWSPP